MRALEKLDVAYTEIDRPKPETTFGLFARLEQRKALVALVMVALGFCVRIYRVDAAGFAEDEANKVFAVRAYEQGDFTVNAEHPMVMKMLCYASVHAAGLWNRAIEQNSSLQISEEAALRLPNVAFGALTVIPLFLLTVGLLGFRVGLTTSLLWAFGLDAIWFNRTVKEDTLLVFFMFWGFYLYFTAKHLPAGDVAGEKRLYSLAGAAFGLMMASKYFPHYWALNALFYTLVGYDSRNNRPLNGAILRKYFAAMLLAFVAFNPALFFPQTWRYLWKYVNEELLTHHGYVVMDKLYINDFLQTPGGNPWYFYFLFIVMKFPLPVLLAFLAGLAHIFTRRGSYPFSRGYVFLRVMLVFWLIPEAVIGTKFLRYSLSLIPLIYMTAAVGIVFLWESAATALKAASRNKRFASPVGEFVVLAIFIIAPVALTLNCVAQSYPSLYVNVFGRNRIGYFFPHDEFYDLGARESIQFVAENAPYGGKIASEIPGVVQYYLERFNRTDIRSEIISQPSFSLNGGRPDYVLLQGGRVYLENLANSALIERSYPIAHASVYEGVAAARVYATGSQMAK
jgi:hypothetical protein